MFEEADQLSLIKLQRATYFRESKATRTFTPCNETEQGAQKLGLNAIPANSIDYAPSFELV